MIHRFDMHIATGKSRRIQPTNEIIEPNATLRFVIDYPLINPYQHEEKHADGKGWTQIEFTDAVRCAYQKIYDAEADPGMVPGMLNRARSEGPYGIWGHVIGDLYLEGVERKNDTWELLVGS